MEGTGVMTNKQLLIAARGYIAKGWTQQEYARKADFESVSTKSPEATCWCIEGAIMAADTNENLPRQLECLDMLRTEANADNIVSWNDAKGRTQTQVLALFDFVISKA